ncbi:hypothetical protein SLE2022_277070 [Rubroshorea leprosula]
MQRAGSFLYANGNDHPPTAVELDKSLPRNLLFNQSPSKDVALASVLMSMVNSSPPVKVFCFKGADHSPFFSKPQSLHKLLVEISKIPST